MFSKILIASLASAGSAIKLSAVVAIYKSYDFSGMEMLDALLDDSTTGPGRTDWPEKTKSLFQKEP